MDHDVPMTDAERIKRLEEKVAQLEAERATLLTEIRSEMARIAGELEEHLITCPGSSKVARRRAKTSRAGQEGQAEGA